MSIGIIGAGYVGLVTGACFSEFGVHVTCVDKDEKKIQSLEEGDIPFYEPGLEELVKRNISQGRLHFSPRIKDAVDSSLALFIAVGTPPRGDGSAELGYIEEVSKEIACHMDSYKVIITKSTVPVGTGKKIKVWIRENMKNGTNFDVASNPEFLREGAAIEDFMRPDRVVIGAETPQAVAILKDLYRPLYLIETPFVIADIETAELIKYASNSYLATKISFINEIANLCDKVGADVHIVAKAMGLDKRIGPKFLHPGPGYGGSCFPKDTMALIHLAKDKGVTLGIVEAAVRANERQREMIVVRMKEIIGDLKGKKIGILGLSFKPNTNDIREAPSIYLIENLLEEGALIQAYDPVASENVNTIFPHISIKEDAASVAEDVHALVLMTEWNQFRNLDLVSIKKQMKEPIFFDFRNVYEPEKMRKLGFRHYCIGRNQAQLNLFEEF
jgi:UDPglucose 6-dehydrogenase